MMLNPKSPSFETMLVVSVINENVHLHSVLIYGSDDIQTVRISFVRTVGMNGISTLCQIRRIHDFVVLIVITHRAC